MKRYFLCMFLVILVVKNFRADDDEIPNETKEEKKSYHHHCYQKDHTNCIATFSKGIGAIMEKFKEKNLKSSEMQEELKTELKPVQEEAYKCFNETEAKKKKCPVGLDRCVIATFIFTDNTTLVTESCESNTTTTCFTLLKLDDYEYYTGKTAKTIKCDFCDERDCNDRLKIEQTNCQYEILNIFKSIGRL